jgi:propionyl-CoA carboxylase alpha chain
VRALNGYHIEGMVTNTDFANALINHPAFVRGELSTSFIDRYFGDGTLEPPAGPEVLHPMVLAAVLVYHSRQTLVRESLRPLCPQVGCMPSVSESRSCVVRAGNGVFRVELRGNPAARRWQVVVDGTGYEVMTPEFEFYRRRLRLQIDGVSHMFRLQYEGSHIRAHFCGVVKTFEVYTPREWELGAYMGREAKAVLEDVLRCPMPGLITAVLVEPGSQVQRGQELVRMESMKMESGVASPCDGRVETILVEPGSVVEADDVLITFG